MSVRLSRRKIASYVADELIGGTQASVVFQRVAAYLTETRRTRDADILVRDIEEALAHRGVMIADVTSAYPLSGAMKEEIKKFTNAQTLHIREKVDSRVLGGIRIDLPGKRFDGTALHKLNALRAKQV